MDTRLDTAGVATVAGSAFSVETPLETTGVETPGWRAGSVRTGVRTDVLRTGFEGPVWVRT
ncbi:hypothetical protein [Caballeronia sp. LZ001]|uniref:hypothetical protein n=1 Tax=Caballeronia sp. LZ001 TaxID=3038553 RepID=UPI002863E4B9|nr:hypothetical protein [Caballeronia sp. LZ001]MDR5801595.1 hypothetical protein [Caballeronia sp. LZ001]